jgi:hypothetical protein
MKCQLKGKEDGFGWVQTDGEDKVASWISNTNEEVF